MPEDFYDDELLDVTNRQIFEYEEDMKMLAGGCYDNLKTFTQKNFRNVWAGSLSKARREDEMARAMA